MIKRKGATTAIIIFFLCLDRLAEWSARIMGLIVDTPAAIETLQSWGIGDPTELVKWGIGIAAIILVWLPWENWLGNKEHVHWEDEQLMEHLRFGLNASQTAIKSKRLKLIQVHFCQQIPNFIHARYGVKERDKYLAAISHSRQTDDIEGIPLAALGHILGFITKRTDKIWKEGKSLQEEAAKLNREAAEIRHETAMLKRQSRETEGSTATEE